MAYEGDRFNLSRKVFVGNISYRVSQKRLETFFSKFGEVEYCYVVKDHIKKWSKGIAFVTFASKEDVQKALAATEDDLNLYGRTMRVKPAEESKRVFYVEGWQQKTDLDKIESLESKDSENTDELKMVDNTTNGLSTIKVDDSSTVNINSLCDDTLILILSHLPVLDRLNAEKVCQRWRDVALRCWTYQKSLHFRNMFKRFEGLRDKLLSSLLHRCGVYLKQLDLSASPRLLTDIAVDVIAENCPALQKLDLSGVAVTDISLRNLGVKCTNLKWIALQKSFYVGDKGLSWFLQNCVNLEYLDVQGNAKIQGDLFHKCGPNLKTVILNECNKLKDFGVSKLCYRCKNLEEIQLSDCLSITDKCIRNLTQECKELRIFHLARIVPHGRIEPFW
ncbi:hypothetical protein KUTeg_010087 [Tegillarca granosa]|uniref:Uncharacterized protein n=1 Tax=Tegillarca granosa TaxID=220873 RepID=A0ABQ9F5Q8_TEGGR|nr:hypothetical protein KUTeg_010087 [Tegillarca granosa]